MIDEATISEEQARAIWLTTFGSGWVSVDTVFDTEGVYPWAAYHILERARNLTIDYPQYRVKIKCKS
jgi:hypothetical protein